VYPAAGRFASAVSFATEARYLIVDACSLDQSEGDAVSSDLPCKAGRQRLLRCSGPPLGEPRRKRMLEGRLPPLHPIRTRKQTQLDIRGLELSAHPAMVSTLAQSRSHAETIRILRRAAASLPAERQSNSEARSEIGECLAERAMRIAKPALISVAQEA